MSLSILALTAADALARGYASPLTGALLGISGLMLLGLLLWRNLPAGTVSIWTVALMALLLAGFVHEWATWAPAIAVAILAIAAAVVPKRMRPLALAAMAVAWAFGVTADWSYGHAYIDVVRVLNRGSVRLLHGVNPYTALYSSTTYRELHVPFVYGPVAVLLAAPASWFGDSRLVSLVCAVIVLVGLYRLRLRTDPTSVLFGGNPFNAAAMLLALPILAMLIWNGWTELFGFAPLVLWLLLRERHPVWGILCIAIAVGVKFTFLPLLFPLWLWSPSMRRDISLGTVVSAVAFYLPFLLWTGPGRFLHDIVWAPLGFPAQPGVLDLSALLVRVGVPAIPVWAAALVLGGAVLALIRMRPRDLADLLIASAGFTFLFFLLQGRAEFNYWALVILVTVTALFSVGLPVDLALPGQGLAGEPEGIQEAGSILPTPS
ncbi:MAG TPA: glycosyltransferase 87 family protein [Candidatus Dormibacteraeota bacterium]